MHKPLNIIHVIADCALVSCVNAPATESEPSHCHSRHACRVHFTRGCYSWSDRVDAARLRGHSFFPKVDVMTVAEKGRKSKNSSKRELEILNSCCQRPRKLHALSTFLSHYSSIVGPAGCACKAHQIGCSAKSGAADRSLDSSGPAAGNKAGTVMPDATDVISVG